MEGKRHLLPFRASVIFVRWIQKDSVNDRANTKLLRGSKNDKRWKDNDEDDDREKMRNFWEEKEFIFWSSLFCKPPSCRMKISTAVRKRVRTFVWFKTDNEQFRSCQFSPFDIYHSRALLLIYISIGQGAPHGLFCCHFNHNERRSYIMTSIEILLK